MNIKNILALVLAAVVAYILIHIFLAAMGMVWSIAITLTKLVFVVVIALPLYLIIRKKFLH